MLFCVVAVWRMFPVLDLKLVKFHALSRSVAFLVPPHAEMLQFHQQIEKFNQKSLAVGYQLISS
jgi:hypothetical protein